MPGLRMQGAAEDDRLRHGAALAGGRPRAAGGYQLMETTIPGQKGEARNVAVRRHGYQPDGAWRSMPGPNPPAALTAGLAAHCRPMPSARRHAFAAGNDAGTAAPVEAGLAAVRALRAQLASHGAERFDARYEIDFRLANKERDYEDAVLAAHDLTFDARGRRRPGDRAGSR